MNREVNKIETSSYVVFEGRRFAGGRPRDFFAKRVTLGPPGSLAQDEIAIRLHVTLPDNILDAVVPTVNIDVPSDLIRQPVIEAVAGDANEVAS